MMQFPSGYNQYPNPVDPELAQKRMSQFLQIMSRWETVSWKEFRNIVAVGVWNKKEKDILFQIMMEHSNDGKKPCDIKNLDLRLLDAVPASFHVAEKLGGSSGIASMVFDVEAMYEDYSFFNPDLLIMNILEGDFARYSGPPRTGKTNTACVAIERWIENDYLCFTNIYMKKKVDGITYLSNARSLLTEIANTSDRFIFVYDEGQASGYSTQTATTLESRYTDALFRVIGKSMGNVLYIDQIEMKTPSIIKEWAMTKVRVMDEKEKGILFIELVKPFEFRKIVRNFPKTKLPFVTKDVASFDMNVNVERMFQLISGKPDEAKDIILEFLATDESIPLKRKKKGEVIK